MNIYFAEKLKRLRTEKKVSQEKLAQYLNVSFQAVSKWENGNSYPDITLLPDIARFFGVTVDELLCVEKLDEERLFSEYRTKANELYRNGNISEVVALWQEAYKAMPNDIDVKEMLMSAYFDAGAEKYFNEFYELATDILSTDDDGRQLCSMYYKSQALTELSLFYASRGNKEEALKWSGKSVPVFNAKEIIETRIDTGEALIADVAFCTYWFLEELFFMACRIDNDESVSRGDGYRQSCFKTVAQIYEAVYKNDDAGFDQLQHLYNLHQGVAEYEAKKRGDEEVIKFHLDRAFECCKKSVTVKEHKLDHPMLYDWLVSDAPEDNGINVRLLSDKLKQSVYDPYRKEAWFTRIETETSKLFRSI